MITVALWILTVILLLAVAKPCLGIIIAVAVELTEDIILLGLSCLCFAIACIAGITDIRRRLFVLETKKQKRKKK